MHRKFFSTLGSRLVSTQRKNFHSTTTTRLIDTSGLVGATSWPEEKYNSEVTKVASEYGVPEELLKDGSRLKMMLHLRELFSKLGIKDANAQKKFWEEVHISPGYSTLEWVQPRPPPEHLYEELPLLKSFPHEEGKAH